MKECSATCFPSRKLYKLDEPDTQDTAGEARTNSSVMYSDGPLHMAKQKQDGQLEHTYIRDVALKTCQKWREKWRERVRDIRDDDDDDDDDSTFPNLQDRSLSITTGMETTHKHIKLRFEIVVSSKKNLLELKW